MTEQEMIEMRRYVWRHVLSRKARLQRPEAQTAIEREANRRSNISSEICQVGAQQGLKQQKKSRLFGERL